MTSKKHYGKQTGRPITHELPTPAGGVRLETFVPWTLVRRGLKKRVITPLDAPQEFLAEAKRDRADRAAAQDSALVRALGLAHHWQRLLDDRRFASIGAIAAAEGFDPSLAGRIARLSRLAPDVVTACLNGTGNAPTLDRLLRTRIAFEWRQQVEILSRPRNPLDCPRSR
jgi:hypothetical protein